MGFQSIRIKLTQVSNGKELKEISYIKSDVILIALKGRAMAQPSLKSPGLDYSINFKPCKGGTTGQLNACVIEYCAALAGLRVLFGIQTQGSASLHPGLGCAI